MAIASFSVSFHHGRSFMQISFLLAFISIEFSFLHGSYFILPCLIPPLQVFHAIFHSFLHVFHWNFHFFMVATSFFLQILSHSPLAAISCNISYLLACISIKFSFLHGSYPIPPWTLSHFPLAAISCNISFLLAFISIKFSFHMAATSYPLGFCLIPLWQLFHAIFHSSWHLFQSNVHSFWYLFHSPLLSRPIQWVIRRVVVWPGT